MSKIKSSEGFEPMGMYAMDNLNSATSHPDHLGVLTRGDGKTDFHGDHTLFDQGDGMIDEATGTVHESSRPLDDTLGLEGMKVINHDVITLGTTDMDAAEAWLQKHDPDYQK